MTLELSSRYQSLMRKIGKAALIAVSKTQPVEAIEALYHLGHRDFGENYVQELLEKAEKLRAAGCDGIRWHFIGHLQTNKVKALVHHVHAVHSVDSEKLALELAKRWKSECSDCLPLPCFIEVNIDQEPTKSGVMPDDVVALVTKLSKIPQLKLMGLMAIPAATDDPARAADSFERLRELEKRCQPMTAGQLSMGMSSDFEVALQHGATHVRVGTALFGQRSSPPFGSAPASKSALG